MRAVNSPFSSLRQNRQGSRRLNGGKAVAWHCVWHWHFFRIFSLGGLGRCALYWLVLLVGKLLDFSSCAPVLCLCIPSPTYHLKAAAAKKPLPPPPPSQRKCST